MGQHTNFRSILEHSGKNWTFVVHTNFQVEISDDTRIFSRRTQNFFGRKINCLTKSLKLFFQLEGNDTAKSKCDESQRLKKRKIHL